jgi:hypothetical protein
MPRKSNLALTSTRSAGARTHIAATTPDTRRDPAAPRRQRTHNVDGNSRLTAIVGIIILPLFLAAFVCGKLAAGGALDVHVAIGLVLAAPIAVKLASVTYRMVSYYRGVAAYRQRGRPSNPRRLLGGALGVIIVLLLGSGLVLIVGPSSAHRTALSIHKVTSYAAVLAVALHLIVHLRAALVLATAELRRHVLKAPGRRARWALVSASLLTGAVLAVMLTSRGSTYAHRYYPQTKVAMVTEHPGIAIASLEVAR